MKTSLLTLAGVLCAGLIAAAAAGKNNAKAVATPNGGRLLDMTQPRAEFVVEKDRTVAIHFYDGAMKPVSATTQTATVIAEAKNGKQKIDFEKRGDSLVSKTKLPEGDGYNVVVQFKPSPDARPQNFRFILDLSNCGSCQRAEYGCTCGH